MEFNAINYPVIKSAYENKKQVEFYVDKSATAFSDSDAPDEWKAYPPPAVPEKDYVQAFVYSGNDIQGSLTRLEILVHLGGGQILYKKHGKDQVLLKVSWPNQVK
ncbi:MAG: hypothetical protein HGA83_09455 [Bacteroidales bacterium]|nr:hypothetical protein [Bacteroidales bacterium]